MKDKIVEKERRCKKCKKILMDEERSYCRRCNIERKKDNAKKAVIGVSLAGAALGGALLLNALCEDNTGQDDDDYNDDESSDGNLS